MHPGKDQMYRHKDMCDLWFDIRMVSVRNVVFVILKWYKILHAL